MVNGRFCCCVGGWLRYEGVWALGISGFVVGICFRWLLWFWFVLFGGWVVVVRCGVLLDDFCD